MLSTERKNETPIFVGLAFALGIFLLNVLGITHESFATTLLASSLLISVCILFPLPIGFGAVLMLLASLSVGQSEFATIQTIRAALIASLCMLLTRMFKRLPPFYLVIFVWLFFLVGLPFANLAITVKLTNHAEALLISFYTELLSVLVLTIFSTTSSANEIFRLRKVEFGAKSYCVQFLSLAVLLTAPIVALFFIGISDSTLEATLSRIVNNTLPFSVLIAVLLFLPLILGLVFGQLIHDFTSALMYAARSQGSSFSERRRWIFKEFKDTVCVVLGSIEGLEGEIRASQSQARQLAQEADAKEKELLDREVRAANLTKLIGEAPWGSLICFADRAMIDANRSLVQMLQLSERDFRGRTIKALVSSHPWSGEIVDILEWSCHSYQDLLKSGVQKYFTSSMHGRYLEVTVQAAPTASALQDSPNKAINRRPPSEIAISMYCRSVPDVRQLQLSAFTPSRPDVVEKHSLIACSWMSSYLKGILDDASELTKTSRNFVNSDSFTTLKLLIQDIERLAQEGLTALSGTGDVGSDEELNECNFFLQLQNSVGYLCDLLAMPHPLPVRLAGSESIEPEETNSSDSTNQHPMLKISERDLNLLLASLMSFISAILPDAEDLAIEVGSEHIGTAAANILASEVSGRFVRIDINHHGQTLASNVALRTLAEISMSDRPVQQIEIAIVMLSFHTRRLGGFLSVQSSASRGTEIAIYIPVARQKAGAIPRGFEGQGVEAGPAPYPAQNDRSRHILLVSPNNDEVSALTKMLVHLGHHVIFDDAESYSAGDDLAFDSGGQGFGSSHSSVFDEADEAKSTSSEVEQASLYDLVIINTTRSYSMGPDQFEAIAKRHPQTAMVFLHEQSAFSLPSPEAFGLKKPFELNDLDRIISGVRKKDSNPETGPEQLVNELPPDKEPS